MDQAQQHVNAIKSQDLASLFHTTGIRYFRQQTISAISWLLLRQGYGIRISEQSRVWALKQTHWSVLRVYQIESSFWKYPQGMKAITNCILITCQIQYQALSSYSHWFLIILWTNRGTERLENLSTVTQQSWKEAEIMVFPNLGF